MNNRATDKVNPYFQSDLIYQYTSQPMPLVKERLKQSKRRKAKAS